MRRIELAETLIALAAGIDPEQGDGKGLFVTEALIDLPLEVSGAVENDELVFFASPPHTRWKSGILPPVHRTILRFELVAESGGPS